MSKLCILADDLTGALDSGVQLAEKGYTVKVFTNIDGVFKHTNNSDILVINTESRHISANSAYDLVYSLSKKAQAMGFKHIYKKTDSGLRGNIGAELSALLDASKKEKIDFVPAYPKLGRITKNGIHYVNGLPLAESIFANDYIDPACVSSIKEIIHLQSDVYVSNEGLKGIVVHDCVDDIEMGKLAKRIFLNNTKTISAGCAGLLEYFPVNTSYKKVNKTIRLNKKLLIISGSMNEITLNQLDNAEKNGAVRYHVPMSKIVNEMWQENKIDEYIESSLKDLSNSSNVIIDTQQDFIIKESIEKDKLGRRIAKSIGVLARKMTLRYPDYTVMITGGDTLQGFVQELGIHLLKPIQEIVPGIVLASYIFNNKENYLITKSGAFGPDNLIEIVSDFLKKESGGEYVIN